MTLPRGSRRLRVLGNYLEETTMDTADLARVDNELWLECVKEARAMVMGGSVTQDRRGRLVEMKIPQVTDQMPEILAKAREIYTAAPSIPEKAAS